MHADGGDACSGLTIAAMTCLRSQDGSNVMDLTLRRGRGDHAVAVNPLNPGRSHAFGASPSGLTFADDDGLLSRSANRATKKK
jgi:hypothetical protein